MRGTMLFVCAANVCRSPLMQYTFLDSVHNPESWEVASAGTSAQEGSPVCDLSLSYVQSEQSQTRAAAHQSAQVDEASLQADLVIVASRAERAALAERSPETRWRVFTLTEAVFLGQFTATPCPQDARQPSTVQQYAQLLNEQRGMFVLPRPRKQRRYLSSWEQPHQLDIPDGHLRSRRSHVSTLKRVRSEIAQLSTQLTSFKETLAS